MTIEFINQEQHDKIVEIQKEHKILTYENKGYDGFDKAKMNDEDIKAFKEVEEILRKHVKGFSSFQNFRIRKDEIQIRLQYDYSADNPHSNSFTGVGYLFLSQLLKGF